VGLHCFVFSWLLWNWSLFNSVSPPKKKRNEEEEEEEEEGRKEEENKNKCWNQW
jgi:hypothetical protein